MRRWLLATAALTAVAAALLLPLGSVRPVFQDPPGDDVATPAEDRRSALTREWLTLHEQMIAVRVEDSLTTKLMADGSAGTIVSGAPESFRASFTSRRFLERLDGVRAHREPTPPAAGRIGVFLVDAFGAEGGPGRTSDEIFAGTLPDATPYCMRVVMRRSPRASWRLHVNPAGRDHPLGLCRYWLRYGAPSPTMLAWLKRGGARYAATDSAEARPAFRLTDWKSRFLDPWSQGFALNTETCIERGPAACAEPFANPRRWGDEPGRRALMAGTNERAQRISEVTSRIDSGERPFAFELYPGDLVLFASLIESEGEEAFRRFWTSDRPIEEAFEEAFGDEPGVWLRRWTIERYGDTDRGPSIGLVTLLVTFGTIGACFGIATLAEIRRSVA